MSTPDHRTVVHIPRLAWCALVVLLIGPWIALVYVLRTPAQGPLLPPVASTTPAAIPPRAAGTQNLTPAQPGPWGDLSYFRILIEPPEEYITSDYIRPDPFVWVFKGYTDATLAALWQTANLDPTERRQLDDPARRELQPGAIVIRPDRELVVGLTPAQRGVLYTALAAFPENSTQNNPYRLRADAVNDWFADSGLSPEILTLTKRLLYERDGTAVFFSDDDVILPMLSTTADRVKFIKTLSRKSAVILQLRIAQGADINAIAQYWNRGRHGKDIRPLLQSLARHAGGGTVDIMHLLPPFARSLVNCYPLPSENPNDAAHDCHWTSFNFFNEQPDERFTSMDFVRTILSDNYYPVPGDPAFGDIVMLVQPDGVAIHSCVYIADNFVFTKNGPAFSVPWTIAPLDGVVSLYSKGQALSVRRYRLKTQ